MNRQVGTRGAVSVFQCLILLALLLLAGLLTDAARILAAQKKVDSALKTSLRSMLAGYDRNLVGEFGIYGRDLSSDEPVEREAFIGYLHSNLDTGGAGFTLVHYTVDSRGTELKGYGSLLDSDIFRRQVLEYMKYRAPAAVTAGILDKLGKSGIFKMLDFSRSEAQVRAKREALKKRIDKANQAIQIADKAGSGSDPALEQLKASLQQVVTALADIRQPLAEYGTVRAASTEFAEQSGFEPCSIEFGGIRETIEDLETKIHHNMQQLERTMEVVRSLDEEMNRLKTREQELNEAIKRLEKESKQENNAAELAEKQAELETVKRLSASQALKRVEALEAYSYLSLEGITFQDPPGAYEYPVDDKARTNVELFLQGYQEKLGRFLRDIPAEWLISREEQKAAEIWDDGLYQELELLVGQEQELEEAERKNSHVLDYLQRIRDMSGFLQASSERGLERLYIMQYIMDKYTYLTSKTERGHYLEKGEVEFILWGDRHQLSNIAKTSGSIWFLRFAIDTVDSFATSKLPHPVARLLSALGEGFLQSCRDMLELYKGKEISLCPSLKNAITVTYGEHLQIFLLLQPPEEQIWRMQQLMQVDVLQADPEFSLSRMNTMLYGKVEVRINLWFLPLLRPYWLDNDKFPDRQYRLVHEFHMHY